MRAAISTTVIAIVCTASARTQDAPLHVPAGFRVSVFAQKLEGVRNLVSGPGSVVYAALQEGGTIVKRPAANNDGHADSAIIMARGLRGPFGIAFRGDTMYVAEMTAVKRFDPGAAQPVTIVPRLPSGGHATRTIVFGPDGKMYVSVGSSCNLCDEGDSMRAAVLQFNRDGSGGRGVWRGLRHSGGAAVPPPTREVPATHNDRRQLGGGRPAARLHIL